MNDSDRRRTEQPESTGNGRHLGDSGFDGEDLRQTLREAEPRVREILASHPVPLLLGALAAGYLIARLMRGDEP